MWLGVMGLNEGEEGKQWGGARERGGGGRERDVERKTGIETRRERKEESIVGREKGGK